LSDGFTKFPFCIHPYLQTTGPTKTAFRQSTAKSASAKADVQSVRVAEPQPADEDGAAAASVPPFM
jgi:hypothetical protein